MAKKSLETDLDSKEFDTEMSRLIRDVRKIENLTAEELGKRIGLTQNYLTRLENGFIKNPSFSVISKIAESISETDAIINMDINLQDYKTPFSMLVMSYLKASGITDNYNLAVNSTALNSILKNIESLDSSELASLEEFISYLKWKNSMDKYKKAMLNYTRKDKFASEIGLNYLHHLNSSKDTEDEINNLYNQVMDLQDNESISNLSNSLIRWLYYSTYYSKVDKR